MTLPPWPYPRWIAHRGAGKLAPENTLAAFRLGAHHGYRMFECDVKLSADDVPFLLHDDTLTRTTNAAAQLPRLGTGTSAVAGEHAWRTLSQLDAGSWHSPTFAGEPLATLTDTASVLAGLGQASQTVLDARGAPRYRGEVEPLDPIAGHIPGALNRPFSDNLGPDGRFKPAAQLQAEFSALLAGRNPASVVHQCGSGVSAVPNLLAMELAGLGRQALYAGSWSEWSRTPGLPVEKG